MCGENTTSIFLISGQEYFRIIIRVVTKLAHANPRAGTSEVPGFSTDAETCVKSFVILISLFTGALKDGKLRIDTFLP